MRTLIAALVLTFALAAPQPIEGGPLRSIGKAVVKASTAVAKAVAKGAVVTAKGIAKIV